jgi:hypothetical protein
MARPAELRPAELELLQEEARKADREAASTLAAIASSRVERLARERILTRAEGFVPALIGWGRPDDVDIRTEKDLVDYARGLGVLAVKMARELDESYDKPTSTGDDTE